MPLLKSFKTIPELYEFLTENFGKNNPNRFVMKHKVDKEWVGIKYSQLKEETETFALGLASLGVKRGDKVSIISENRPEWVYSDMAILGLGAIDVPLYPSLTSESIEFIINNSDSVGIICSTKLQLNKILKIRNNCRALKFIIVLNEKDFVAGTPNLYTIKDVQERGKEFSTKNKFYFKENIRLCRETDLATIIYTSGTTGEPKGVMLTHKNVASNIIDTLNSYPIGSNDVFLSFLPVCHIFERVGGYYMAFAAGAEVCYAQSIETVANDLQEVKPTLMTAVPRLFERIYAKVIKNVEAQPAKKQKIFYWALNIGLEYRKAKRNNNVPIALGVKQKIADALVLKKIRMRTGGNLRFFISGGAALARELGEFFEACGMLIVEGYGLTESSPVLSANRFDNYKFGTVGKPYPSVEIKIASDGEILARGPNIMQGYYKNKKETDETIKDGWLHTGDIGVFDAEGFLVITDRKKNLFKTSSGKYIAPTPLENLFLASKYIDQFVLIGDKRMFLSALIVPDFEALKEYADSHKIKYDKPEELIENQEVTDLIENELQKFHKSLASYEKVRKFALLSKPFSIEGGEITPSLKLKRGVIEERYKSLIEEMYAELNKK
ncbi:MAG: long-chain fatty acid--CoA ligase [Chlorobiaceae bacterium]|nr:long-chain fatty acid--CoA ligase [Chlorobiaceae bacterium]MBA4309648.1 long-chain fatty acid--CoA ligase [Chlorobiaceae bacterium]